MIILRILNRKKLIFEKLKLSKSKINSDEACTITFNIKNFKEKFEKIVAKTRTDDLQNQYLKIDKPIIELPSLDFPNRNTGDHTVTIAPYNIPLSKMSFKIILEIIMGDNGKLVLKKEFNLKIDKKLKN